MGTDKGVKLDDGKRRFHEVLFSYFPNALRGVCDVSEFGAKKYCVGGWKSVKNGHTRYSDALLRHYLDECSGETHDSDSALHHDLHVAWNALARAELRLRAAKKEMDNGEEDIKVTWDTGDRKRTV